MWTRPEVRPTLILRLGEQAAGLGWERLTPGVDWWTKTVHERKAVHGRMHAPGRPAREAARQHTSVPPSPIIGVWPGGGPWALS